MPTVNLRTLKDQLSRFVRRAEAGERIVVVRGGRPVAALVPFAEMPASGQSDTLARLAAGEGPHGELGLIGEQLQGVAAEDGPATWAVHSELRISDR